MEGKKGGGLADVDVIEEKRYFKTSTAASFSNTLHCKPPLNINSTVHKMVRNFNCKLRSVLDRVAPEKTKEKSLTTKMPWKNEQINQLKRDCQEAEQKWRKTKLTIHCEILNNCINIYNNAARTERQKFYSRLINDKRTNPRVFQ